MDVRLLHASQNSTLHTGQRAYSNCGKLLSFLGKAQNLEKQQKEHRKTPANEDGSTVGDSARAGRSSSWPKHEKKSCAGSANKEDKRFLSNYCAYIHAPNKGTICLVAADLGALYKKILACLLYGGLLKGRKLVFIVDGAKDLIDHTQSVLSFVDHKLILDWHHLAKKI